MTQKRTTSTLQTLKNDGHTISMLTAYEYTMASLLNTAEIDIILVGDSLGNLFSGYQTTLPVTLDEMIYHSKAVAKAASYSMVLTDLPFMSYQVSPTQACESAGRLVKEGFAEAVKMEVNPAQLDHVKAVIDTGIPVMAHIGFTPQQVHQLGGYKIQGKTDEAKEALLSLATQLQAMGVFSILMEMVPASLSKTLHQSLEIPTIGIGAGPHCDGQVLVTHDLLGLTQGKTPKFVRQYKNLAQETISAIQAYQSDIQNKTFPNDKESF
jgi:3-methyl-2-oxobutanoate hydroxymethyltransferase